MSIIPKTKDELWAIFNVSVERTPHCWIWKGTTGKRKYGYVTGEHGSGARKIYAHRLSWMLYRGDITPQQHVCHRCDNPLCVNPVHLFLGDMRINHLDKIAKGRQAKGERVKGSKLTAKEVIEIRKELNVGIGQQILARKYGVDPSSISNINRGRYWKHIHAGASDVGPTCL